MNRYVHTTYTYTQKKNSVIILAGFLRKITCLELTLSSTVKQGYLEPV